jgi:hypothetical protein
VPLILAPQTIERTKKVQGSTPWVWLWQIVADETELASPTFALVNYPKALTFRGVTYHPFPISPGEISMDADSLPSLELRIANVFKVVARQLHTGHGFIGRSADLSIVPLDLIDAAEGAHPHSIDWSFHVASASADERDVTLRCEVPNFFIREYPEQRITPGRCRFRFGLPGGGCPYVLTSAAGFTSCGKTQPDCHERGQDMKARGYPEWVALPIGSFPGTDTGT